MAKIGASDHRSVTTTSVGKMEETATGAAGGASEKASEKRLIAYGRIGPGFIERRCDLIDRDLRRTDRSVFIAFADRHGARSSDGKTAARNQKTDAE